MFAIVLATVLATNLTTVVVEASRTDATVMNIPSGVHVIRRDEIDRAHVRDVVELLHRKAPELHISHLGGANPALAQISMRGYGESGYGRTLVLVDGERLNSPDMNTPNLSRIALGSIDRIEILGGSQSVLQGDGASAGVINIITEPKDYQKTSFVEFHGGSWGSFGSAIGTRGGIEEDGLKYWADGSWDRSDGYRAHSAGEIWNLNGGVKKEWQSGTSLKVSGFYNDSHYELPGYLSYREWKDSPRRSHSGDDSYWRATYGFNATFDAHINDENELKTRVSFSQRQMGAYQRWGLGDHTDSDYRIYSTEISPEWVNTTSLLDCENEFVLGTLYRYDTLHGISPVGQGVPGFDYDRQTMDFFAQDTFHFNETYAMQLGGRYSRTWSYNELASPQTRNDHLAAGDVALIWNPTDTAKVYLKGSHTYRSPFLDEVPYDTRTWQPMGLLEPEHGFNAEVGFEWQFEDEFSIGGDAYYSYLENEIFYDAVHGNNVNSSDPTTRPGVDLHASWSRDKVAEISGAFSWVKAQFSGGDFANNAIPLVPETSLSLNGRVWIWNECTAFGGYRFQSDTVSASDFGNEWDKIGWFGIFHIGADYESETVECLRGVKFSVTVDNLLDENYCDYSTYGACYYPAAGRSFTFSVRYQF